MSKHVVCVPLGVSKGSDRFPDRNRAPKIKAWRCDLTALSKVYNLYFIACNDTIHVHQPSFPDQSLSKDPALILHPPVSAPNLPVGIDCGDHHSVTRILVDYLGNDEILLATCDDGDVVGYRIEEIQRAVNIRLETSSEGVFQPPDLDLRTFLHRNVGASAWGLAVHREGRMIAISANTHDITVLAYALAKSDDDTESSEVIEATVDGETSDFPHPRTRDHIITMTGDANIPAVSFNNTGDDPTGRWLISSAISGRQLIWDLHSRGAPARLFQMGWCVNASQPNEAPLASFGRCQCRTASNIPHGAWGAMFLDSRSAQEVNKLDFAQDPSAPDFADLSPQKRRFTLPSTPDHYLNWDLDSLLANAAEVMSDNDDESQMIISDDESSHSDSSGPALSPMLQATEDNDVAAEELMPDYSNTNSNIDAISLEPGGTATVTEATSSDFSPDPGSPVYHPQDDAEPISPVRSFDPKPYCDITTSPTFRSEESHMPCLLISKDDIYLIQRPLDSARDHVDLVQTMRHPLHPQDPNDYIGHYDRQCFHTQIPELGVFIIGSPVGRAAIFSLTKLRKPRPADHGKSVYGYGFHLEYILPFSAHDETNIWSSTTHPQCPRAMLMGVAVGPVQGMFDEVSGNGEVGRRRDRRWRLLMYYTDHSVLSFEIARKRVGQEPGLGDLVV